MKINRVATKSTPAVLDPLCSETTRRSAESDLARSGLSLAALRGEGVFAVDNAQAINPQFAPKPAIIFPYHDVRGGPAAYEHDGQVSPFCRVRYLPTGWGLPNGQRYAQPAGSGTPPFFPRGFDWRRVGQGGITILGITEGEKKAIAATLAGFPTIGIGGVDNFGDGRAPLHPALAATASKASDICILFDADIASKPRVQAAEWRLAGQLALLGVRVHLVRLPQETKGLDDFLVAHGRKALLDLIASTPALGEFADPAASQDELAVADILKRDVLPVQELVPGWLEKGIPTFLAGPGGVHKSRLAMQWGLCLNAGVPIWGLGGSLGGIHQPKVSVVFCAAEDDENELARRAQAIASTLKLPRVNRGLFVARKGKDSALIHVHEDAKVEMRAFYHQLVARLRSIAGHKLVVLDSAYDFVRFVGRAKIDEDAVNHFIKVVLQGICDQTDSTLLIPWHPSQAGSERASMDGWSVAWHNAPRARLGMSAVADVEDTFELKVVKRNHGRSGQSIQIRFTNGALLPLDAVPDEGKAEALQQVVVKAAIEAAGHGIPINRARAIPGAIFKEAEKATGRRPSKQQVKDALDDAVALGLLSYLVATRHRAAGYYPPNTEEAVTLARTAKKAARSSDDE